MDEMRRFLATEHQARLLAEANDRRLSRALLIRRTGTARAAGTRAGRVGAFLTTASDALDTSGHRLGAGARGTVRSP
jgi:hypothetical protein